MICHCGLTFTGSAQLTYEDGFSVVYLSSFVTERAASCQAVTDPFIRHMYISHPRMSAAQIDSVMKSFLDDIAPSLMTESDRLVRRLRHADGDKRRCDGLGDWVGGERVDDHRLCRARAAIAKSERCYCRPWHAYGHDCRRDSLRDALSWEWVNRYDIRGTVRRGCRQC
jgi:hypothetical protein